MKIGTKNQPDFGGLTFASLVEALKQAVGKLERQLGSFQVDLYAFVPAKTLRIEVEALKEGHRVS